MNMTNRKFVSELPFNRPVLESGSYPRISSDGVAARTDRVASAVDELSSYDICEIWQRVAYWIAQLVPGDHRRRLLELAQLRHDSNLADAVLRHL
jgi:hypothetical protein